MNAPDLSHGVEELAGLIDFRVGAWHDFGYETPPTPDCKPIPPLGERSAEAIKDGHRAIEAIDELTRQLHARRTARRRAAPGPGCAQRPRRSHFGRGESRPRAEADMRDIVDAIPYLTHNGPVWRALPADFPPAWTVYYWAGKWAADGSTARMHDDLRDRVRAAASRRPAPTAAIIDSQSVKGSEMVARRDRGNDAGNKINGTQRHLAVDVTGLLLTVLVTAASVQDRDAAKPPCCGTCAALSPPSSWPGPMADTPASSSPGPRPPAPDSRNRQTAR